MYLYDWLQDKIRRFIYLVVGEDVEMILFNLIFNFFEKEKEK